MLRYKRHISSLPLPLWIFSLPSHQQQDAHRGLRLSNHPVTSFAVAFLLAILAAAAIPAVDYVYGVWTQQIASSQPSAEAIRAASRQAGYIIFSAGAAQLVMTWASLYAFMLASEILTCRLRDAFVASVLAQDVDWFTSHGEGQICTIASSHMDNIRVAFGEKMLHISSGVGVLLGSTILGFLRAPSIAGVLFPIIPITMLAFAILGKLNEKVSRPAAQLEGRIANFVEQVLTSLPVVQSFSIGTILLDRLQETLFNLLARKSNQRAIIRAFELSSVYAVMMWNYSVFFAWGAHQIAAGHTQVGPATTAFWSFINCFFTMANIVPHLGALVNAFSSLRTLRDIIEHEPSIDPRDQRGYNVNTATFQHISACCFRLEDVSFAYPTRPDVLALSHVTLDIEYNKLVAFVGPSGSGKSTLLSLLLREYDIVPRRKPCDSDLEKAADLEHAGRLLFAGCDLREYNITAYRSQLAVVSQQLHLFSGSVLDNVAAGLSTQQLAAMDSPVHVRELTSHEQHRDARVRDEAVAALKKAQAWEFVARLPQGIDTCIAGGSTNVLSGGQKQRLALARALIRKPKILFLDEATSALDSSTEESIRLVIQEEQRQRSMTCCVVAHRLSTVRQADKIIVFVNGRITDQGTHEDLMNGERKDDTYRSMVLRQMQCFGDGPSTQTGLGQEALDAKLSNSSMDARSTSTQSMKSEQLKLHPHLPAVAEIPTLDDVNHAAVPPQAGSAIIGEASDLQRPLASREIFSALWMRISDLKLRFAIGCTAALVASAVFPAGGYLTGKGVAALAGDDTAAVQSQGYFWALMLFVMGIADAFLYTTQGFLLESASSCVCRTFQLDSLRRLASQSLSTVALMGEDGGSLASAVVHHAAQVSIGIGTVLGNVLLSTGNFLGSVVLAFALSWRATIVTFAPILLVLAANYLSVTQLQRAESAFTSRTERCTKFLSEIILGIRTIATLGRQEVCLQAFMEKSRLESTSIRPPLFWGSFGFAIGQSFMVLPSALVFYWVGLLYAGNKIELDAIYAVFELQLITGFAAARLTAFVPDIGRALMSLRTICGWLTRPIFSTDTLAVTPVDEYFELADIQFDNVTFEYPQRSGVQVLKNVSLGVVKGSTVAFVGTSGSGKSTALALLSRFYDPSKGKVLMHDHDLRSLNLDSVRERTALVSQDAVLFQGTIRWNVAIGASPRQEVGELEIRAACRQADAMEFIDGLPEGLDTDIGLKGSLLSGGQRQRLCIARALIREPELLLLDEASSALDAASEAAVQNALAQSPYRRTTIIVAHRLASIRHVDCIFVFEDGKVVEKGSPAELVARESRFREVSAHCLPITSHTARD